MLVDNTHAIADALAQIQSVNASKHNKIFKCFCRCAPSCENRGHKCHQNSRFGGGERSTANLYFGEIRRLILLDCMAVIKDAPQGQFELDESYLGAKRIRGKRGCGAAEKTPAFGLLKRDGKVFVTIVENCSRNILIPVIQEKILEGSTVHADGWKAYYGLVLNGYDHYRVYHSKDVIADAPKGNLRRRIFDNLDALLSS